MVVKGEKFTENTQVVIRIWDFFDDTLADKLGDIRDEDFHLLKFLWIILESSGKIGTTLLVVSSRGFIVIYKVWMDTRGGTMSLHNKIMRDEQLSDKDVLTFCANLL
jgi:hypothetical protein